MINFEFINCHPCGHNFKEILKITILQGHGFTGVNYSNYFLKVLRQRTKVWGGSGAKSPHSIHHQSPLPLNVRMRGERWVGHKSLGLNSRTGRDNPSLTASLVSPSDFPKDPVESFGSSFDVSNALTVRIVLSSARMLSWGKANRSGRTNAHFTSIPASKALSICQLISMWLTILSTSYVVISRFFDSKQVSLLD